MIVLGSWDSAGLAEPRELQVVRVLRGGRPGRRSEYAVAAVVHPTGATEWVAVRLRRRRRWRPRPTESEALVWRLTGPEDRQVGGRFDEPSAGAAIGYVLDGDLRRQREKWRVRARFGRRGAT